MASAWIDHVKKVAKDKGIKYNEALKVAGKTWKGTEKKQSKQDRLDESEGKKKGMKKMKQSASDRLDEAEGKKKGKSSK